MKYITYKVVWIHYIVIYSSTLKAHGYQKYPVSITTQWIKISLKLMISNSLIRALLITLTLNS